MIEAKRRIAFLRRAGTLRGCLLCAAGIAINMICAWVTTLLRLPSLLDILGTVLSAALGGYLPGIIVGFVTRVLEGLLLDSAQLYYSSLDMIVAVCAAAFARKGWFKRLPTTIAAALIFFGIKVGLGTPLTWFLNNADIGGMTARYARHIHENSGVGRFWAQLAVDSIHELIDIPLVAAITYVILKRLPESFQEAFRHGNWWQAELPAEMRDAVNRRVGKGMSLSTRVVLVVSIGALSIASAAIIISFQLFKNSMKNERIQMAEGLTMLVERTIDVNKIEEYIELGEAAENYNAIERQLVDYKLMYSDVEYLYIYQIKEDGCHVVFDLDSPDVKGSEPGEVIEFDEAFYPYLDDLLAGRRINPIVSDEKYGALLTVYHPVYDKNHVCQCYIGVDFSMDILSTYGTVFIVKLITMLIGFFVMVLAFGLRIAMDNVIIPINTMAYCADAFAYNSEEARAANVEQLRRLDICTGDEVENLYRAFLKTTEDSMNYVENLLHAKVEVEVMKEQVSAMDELAYKDALTGVRNKTAYDQYIMRLEGEIFRGEAAFGIVMIDLNYLKRINDTYGHEQGNTYLKQCCELVCAVFDHSPVFRVGGDEFIAVLEKNDLKERDTLIAQLKAEMKKRADSKLLEPWEQVSAAVGLAVYEPGKDRSADDVFKRADKAMYADKLAMKAVRTD